MHFLTGFSDDLVLVSVLLTIPVGHVLHWDVVFVGQQLPGVLQHALENEGLLFVEPLLDVRERQGLVATTASPTTITVASKPWSVVSPAPIIAIRPPSTTPATSHPPTTKATSASKASKASPSVIIPVITPGHILSIFVNF